MGAECRCGCGLPAPVAQRTNARLGHVKGEPLAYRPGHNRRGSTALDRYQHLPTGCWRWMGSRNRKGYGRAQVDREHTTAHRAMFEVAHGQLPRDTHLHHECGNPWCVNPAHLTPVVAHEHGRVGARLTPADAAEIRAAGGTHEAIGQRFGVSRQLVGDIKSGRRWSVR